MAAEPLAKRIASLQEGSVSLGMLTQRADPAMDAAIRAAEGAPSARGVPGEVRVEVPLEDTRRRVASLQETLGEAVRANALCLPW